MSGHTSGHAAHSARSSGASTQASKETEAPPPTRQVEWMCPMHPEIVRSEPGSCPICGMSPILASVAMSFSSVSVIANALRLRRVELAKANGEGERAGEQPGEGRSAAKLPAPSRRT